MTQLISDNNDWSIEKIQAFDLAIGEIAEGYGLEIYSNQIEIINAAQMMEAYATIGMPIGYNHWSYGKKLIQTEQQYQKGYMGLAYEIVINSNPCIAYLMEENTLCMQAMVIAHACYGHNSFFKNNYLFKSWTDAEGIIDYLLFAKQYISECEHRHGVEAVESLLDSCHALMNFGVDRYKRPYPMSASEERAKQQQREIDQQRMINDLWRTVPKALAPGEQPERFLKEPQENLLYFLEKQAPLLEQWQREIIRIVRKISQYFYPQKQTQVMNEGWASFWHYRLMNDLYDQGKIDDSFMLEFMHMHSAVIAQPPFDSPYFNGINPYTLGFAIFNDIKRVCEEPTDEDREWFSELVGKDWLEQLKFAAYSFKDESFILQYLSPKVMRDLGLFSIVDDDREPTIKVDAIHDEQGYEKVREALAADYNLGNREPNIQVVDVAHRTDRTLYLHHTQFNRQPLAANTDVMLHHLQRLWGFGVHLTSQDPTGAPVIYTAGINESRQATRDTAII